MSAADRGIVWIDRNTTSPVDNYLPDFITKFDIVDHPIFFSFPLNVLVPIIASFFYLLMVTFLPRFIKHEYSLKTPLAFWNLFLSVSSILILIPWVSSIYTEFKASGFSWHHIICQPNGQLGSGSAIFCAMCFSVLKIFEFGDTLFLILRKREVSFLHCFHHSTVLLFAWYTLITLYPIANIFGTVNASVHAIMYGYFFLAAVSTRPWWGRHVTKIQIVQMVIGLVTTSLWTYWYLIGNNCTLFIHGGRLSWGDKKAFWASEKVLIGIAAFLYGSYFILFLQFYFNRFGGEGGDSKRNNAAGSKRPDTGKGRATTVTTKSKKESKKVK